jgi:hypothetical protein
MGLKQEIQRNMREARNSAIAALLLLGFFTYAAVTWNGAGWTALNAALMACMILVFLGNWGYYLRGRDILRNPLFYLLAIQHDLGNESSDGA